MSMWDVVAHWLSQPEGHGFDSCSSRHLGQVLYLVSCALRRETPIQYLCCSRERLWVVVDLKRRYRHGQNEWMYEQPLVCIQWNMRYFRGNCFMCQVANGMVSTSTTKASLTTTRPVSGSRRSSRSTPWQLPPKQPASSSLLMRPSRTQSPRPMMAARRWDVAGVVEDPCRWLRTQSSM